MRYFIFFIVLLLASPAHANPEAWLMFLGGGAGGGGGEECEMYPRYWYCRNNAANSVKYSVTCDDPDYFNYPLDGDTTGTLCTSVYVRPGTYPSDVYYLDGSANLRKTDEDGSGNSLVPMPSGKAGGATAVAVTASGDLYLATNGGSPNYYGEIWFLAAGDDPSSDWVEFRYKRGATFGWNRFFSGLAIGLSGTVYAVSKNAYSGYGAIWHHESGTDYFEMYTATEGSFWDRRPFLGISVNPSNGDVWAVEANEVNDINGGVWKNQTRILTGQGDLHGVVAGPDGTVYIAKNNSGIHKLDGDENGMTKVYDDATTFLFHMSVSLDSGYY